MKKIMLILLFIIYSGTAEANIKWFLSDQEIHNLSSISYPILFTDYSFLILLFFVSTGLSLFIAYNFEKNYLQSINSYLDQYLLPFAEKYSATIIRIAIGFMILFSSLGALPKLGTSFMASKGIATLFAPEFQLTQLLQYHHLWAILIKIQLCIGVLLIIGCYTRICSFLLLGMLLFCTYTFGILKFPYLLFFLPSIIVMLYLGNGTYVTTNLPKYNYTFEQYIQSKISWRYIYRSVLLILGSLFILMAIGSKIMFPNHMIAILETYKFPNFGFTYDIILLVMSIIEFMIGCFLISGFLLRQISLVTLIIIALFSYFFNSPILFYGHYIAIFSMIFLLGNHPIIDFKQYIYRYDHDEHSINIPAYQRVYEDYI